MKRIHDPNSWAIITFSDSPNSFEYIVRGASEEDAQKWFDKRVSKIRKMVNSKDSYDYDIIIDSPRIFIYEDDDGETETYLMSKEKEINARYARKKDKYREIVRELEREEFGL